MRVHSYSLGFWAFAAVAAVTSAACSPSSGDGETGAGGLPNAGGAGGSPGASGGAANAGGTPAIGNATGSGGFVSVGTETGGAASFEEGGIDALLKASCAANSARTEALPAVLEFVVDTSGSMGDPAPGTLFQTKWDVTREALRQAMNALPDSTGVGIMYFPEMNGGRSTPKGNESDPARPLNACVDLKNQVGIDVVGVQGSPHRTQIDTSLSAPGRPNGGTPTHDAYNVGVAAMAASTLPGNHFVVLITDGQPTYAEGCRGTGRTQDANDPKPIITAATAAAAKGIHTFVIGSPGSEQVGAPGFADARTWLSLMASTGGTATPGCNDNGPNFCHFDMTQQTNFSQALQDTLKLIVGSVVGCDYNVPVPAMGGTIDPDKVNVVYTPTGQKAQLIPKWDGVGDCTDGWRFNADNTKVQLCSNTCNVVRADIKPALDVIFGCSSQTRGPR
jgi:hypothetical protein